MPPSTTFGPKPYEGRLIETSRHLVLILAFSPEAFIQKGAYCEGRYQVRLTLWQGQHLLFWGEKRLTFRASSTGLPDSSNLHVWALPVPPSARLRWTLECWDIEQSRAWMESDTFQPGAFQPLFLSSKGTLGSFSEILAQSAIILISPTPMVEVALYQAESKLPGMQRYLSLQERRFLGVKTQRVDTLRLDWREEELRAGEYLIGIYAYKGNAVAAEAFYRVFKRAS